MAPTLSSLINRPFFIKTHILRGEMRQCTNPDAALISMSLLERSTRRIGHGRLKFRRTYRLCFEVGVSPSFPPVPSGSICTPGTRHPL
jgi:hypothetical protein